MPKEDVNALNNFIIWKMAKDISLIDINPKENITLSDLALKSKINRKHPYFSKLIDFLIEKKIIIVIKNYGRTRVVNINIKALDNLIEDNEVWNEFIDYVHNKKLIRIGV